MKQWTRPVRPEPPGEHCCAKCEFCIYDENNPARLGLCGCENAQKEQKQTVMAVKVYAENKCVHFAKRGTAS